MIKRKCRIEHGFVALIMALLCEATIAAPHRLFDVTLEDVSGGGRVLNVSFYSQPPPPTVVDRILRESLEHAALVDSKADIVGMAFLGDDELSSNQYSGSLIYKASLKKIVTMDEYRGVKTTTSSVGTYFVEVQEEKTLTGIKPERKWLSLMIVFPKTPAEDLAYDAIVKEVQKLIGKGLDVDAYVSVGDRAVKTSWQQMRAKDGAYVFAEYDAIAKTLTRKGRLIRNYRG
jgi:hypothetical protein